MKMLPGARGRRARQSRPLARLAPALLGLLVVASQANCGAGGEDTGPTAVASNLPPLVGGGTGDGQASGGTFVPEDCVGAQCDIADPVTSLPAPPGCANGTLDKDEACDDGNKNSDDGCAGNCLATEKGFSCPTAGQPCRPIALCGDGVKAATEPCDDGNTDPGDGCSKLCRVELGHKCDGSPSVCTDTVCGDRNREGAEGCDDGNTQPFDGCSATCTREPTCPEGTSCTSECGDGLVLNEECDDGNLIDGDGCSSTCTTEAGFDCVDPAPCEQINGECVLRVPVVFRDFPASQPDFIDGQNGCMNLTRGTVNAKLDANGRPVLNAASPNLAQACLSTPANFSAWYTDHPGEVTVVGELVLFDNHQGGYVNRYGANGEQWTFTANNSQTQMGATLPACQAECQNRGINGQAPLTGPQLRCDDNCRADANAVQQFTNGGLQQAQQQLTQATNANPPNPVTIAAAQAAVTAAQAQLVTLQDAAAACTTDCEALLVARVAPCQAKCHPCAYPNTGFCVDGTVEVLDGTPLFFPVDRVTGPTANQVRATIPAQYGLPQGAAGTSVFNGFPAENVLFPNAPLHNFYFTTDVEYWFKYEPNLNATLTFLGDDDVWVFINGNLAVDLGGLHVPSKGSVTINAAAGTVVSVTQDGRGLENTPSTAAAAVTTRSTTGAFGLTAGNVYKIDIFHAERKVTGSSFQLTLAGFDAKPSNCLAKCGDGILSFGEECDNGVEANNGLYGECGADCRLAPFCGDGVPQPELGETCDVGPGGDSTCRGCRTFTLR